MVITEVRPNCVMQELERTIRVKLAKYIMFE